MTQYSIHQPVKSETARHYIHHHSILISVQLISKFLPSIITSLHVATSLKFWRQRNFGLTPPPRLHLSVASTSMKKFHNSVAILMRQQARLLEDYDELPPASGEAEPTHAGPAAGPFAKLSLAHKLTMRRAAGAIGYWLKILHALPTATVPFVAMLDLPRNRRRIWMPITKTLGGSFVDIYLRQQTRRHHSNTQHRCNSGSVGLVV